MKRNILNGIVLIMNILILVSMTKSSHNKIEENVTLNEDKNLLSFMLETEVNSGKYQETKSSTWPSDDYVFNTELSKCEQGSRLSWDSTKKTVVMIGDGSDKCYIYFDKENILLSNYIKSQYTGTQGENNLYYHDSTLTNGAGDNSYRYAGSSDTTNNFVCFGYDSTAGTCSTDHLYRIIGVFDNQVKLIKYDYGTTTELGTDGDYDGSFTPNASSNSSYYKGSLASINTYYWNSGAGTGTNTWSESRLNTTNLNTNYLKNIGTEWSNKIANHTWKVGGNTLENITEVTAPNVYKNEITSPADTTTYDAKVGLMYVSDYGYAAAPSAWTKLLSYDSENGYNNSSVTSVNWMYMGLWEWTISRYTGSSNVAFDVGYDGRVDGEAVYRGSYAVRPVFYLTSSTTYVSGDGTMSKPFIIN